MSVAATLPCGTRQPAATAESRLLCELCALLLTVLRPSPLPRHATPAGVASMLLGASVALMLCGSVTFMLGFFLMPWVLALACAFLLVGFLTNLSVVIGRAVFLSSPHKEASSPSGHIFSKPSFTPM